MRVPPDILAWLEEKRSELAKGGLHVPLSTVLRQQLERMRKLDGVDAAPVPLPLPKKAKRRL